jgi:hypothetical protein
VQGRADGEGNYVAQHHVRGRVHVQAYTNQVPSRPWLGQGIVAETGAIQRLRCGFWGTTWNVRHRMG